MTVKNGVCHDVKGFRPFQVQLESPDGDDRMEIWAKSYSDAISEVHFIMQVVEKLYPSEYQILSVTSHGITYDEHLSSPHIKDLRIPEKCKMGQKIFNRLAAAAKNGDPFYKDCFWEMGSRFLTPRQKKRLTDTVLFIGLDKVAEAFGPPPPKFIQEEIKYATREEN